MDNGTTDEVISQFNIIAKLPDYWDHNQQYQNYLLKQIKNIHGAGLDIGCGTGEFTKKITTKCEKITGIDISKIMIDEAQKRNSNNNNTMFINIDIDTFLNQTKDMYDVIISIATFHHLDMERTLRLLKTKLNRNGIILILDLYNSKSIFEFCLSFFATICNPIIYLIKRGSLCNTKEERDAWKDHFQYDKYYTVKEIKEIARKTLGKVKIKRHLFWRYSLIYVKNGET